MWDDVYETIDQRITEEVIASLIGKLLPEEETVILARYWLGATYSEISKILKVSTERIRQREAKALRRFRSGPFEKEFRKLDIDWVEKIYEDNERIWAERERKKAKEQLEWHKKCVAERIAKAKETEALKKLQVKYHDHVPPEMVVVKSKPIPSAPMFPPSICKVDFDRLGKPFIYVAPCYGTIHRDLDPETYDRWLDWLLSNQKYR